MHRCCDSAGTAHLTHRVPRGGRVGGRCANPLERAGQGAMRSRPRLSYAGEEKHTKNGGQGNEPHTDSLGQHCPTLLDADKRV